MTKSDPEFNEFIKFYPEIEEIKNYENEKDFGIGALGFLRHFYVKVWGSYADYVENDLVLYEIFKGGNDGKDFIIEARVAVLDKMYGTQIKAIRKIINNFKSDIENKDFDSIINVLSTQKNEQKENNCTTEMQFSVRKETSFVSKYFHWYNEVNNRDASPIYDGNVKNGLEKYEKYEKYGSIKKINDMKNLKISIDDFINKLRLKGTDRINIKKKKIENFQNKEHDCLYENISIYRLVDKFLWLTYKIAEAKSEKNESKNKDASNKKNKPQIPNEVRQEFNKLMEIIKMKLGKNSIN